MDALASLAFARTGFHFDGDHGLIVERYPPPAACSVTALKISLTTQAAYLAAQPATIASTRFRPKRLTVAVARVENAVAVEHEQISRLGLEN